MATVYGVNATKRDVTVPSEKINVNEDGGRMRVKYDEYVAAGALSTSDIIKLMKLPKGAKVYNAVLDSTDLGTVGTLDLGWAASSDAVEAADADGFLAAVDVNAAAALYDMQQDNRAAAGLFKSFDADVDIQINVSAATDAGGTIRVALYYTLD